MNKSLQTKSFEYFNQTSTPITYSKSLNSLYFVKMFSERALLHHLSLTYHMYMSDLYLLKYFTFIYLNLMRPSATAMVLTSPHT